MGNKKEHYPSIRQEDQFLKIEGVDIDSKNLAIVNCMISQAKKTGTS